MAANQSEYDYVRYRRVCLPGIARGRAEAAAAGTQGAAASKAVSDVSPDHNDVVILPVVRPLKIPRFRSV